MNSWEKLVTVIKQKFGDAGCEVKDYNSDIYITGMKLPLRMRGTLNKCGIEISIGGSFNQTMEMVISGMDLMSNGGKVMVQIPGIAKVGGDFSNVGEAWEYLSELDSPYIGDMDDDNVDFVNGVGLTIGSLDQTKFNIYLAFNAGYNVLSAYGDIEYAFNVACDRLTKVL